MRLLTSRATKSPKECDEVPEECYSTADVKQVTKTPQQQQLSDAPEPAAQVVSDHYVSQKPLSKLATRQRQQSQQYSWTKNHSTRRNLWCSRLQKTASREQCDSSWNESGSRMKPNVDTNVPVLGLQIEHRENEDRASIFSDVAVLPIETSAWKRTNSKFTTRRDLCSACSSNRIRFSSFRCLCSNSSSERVCSTRTSHLPSSTSITKRCGQLLRTWFADLERAELFSD